MSSDYRPRGGGGGGNSGGRRRRGGRNRGGHGNYSGNRSYSNGTPGGPNKKKGVLAKFFGWLFPGKKAKPDLHPDRGGSPRPDFKARGPRPEFKDRPPREDRPKAEPVLQEIVSPKLYVGNLSYDAVESDLFDLFSKIGAVKNVEVAMDRHANRSKGFGFVEMETLETAKEASAKLNRTDFMGRQIVVSGAKLDRRPSPREEAADSNPDSGV